ncbi:Dabb family protein [Nocardia iowensis]|uniref:Dabb family protein n=1 Tax=Nocardia iowensis TaxID=204891 RepID=A0ABX8RTP1_NOCIO|nr:Dabb family protein [Nocardia iowensis]QXN93008.1 Dabb family protein [Nocardia iowensis]
MTADAGSNQVLTHVVLMKFHNRSDAEKAAELLTALVDSVPQIRTLTVSLDELATPVSYDLCLTTTHDSPDDLSAYQDHPAHRELAQWLVPRLAARAVVDYHVPASH